MAPMGIDLSKRTIVIITGVAIAGVLFIVLIMPLLSKTSKLSREVKALDFEMAAIREALDESKKIKRGANFLSRNEISHAIDEITKVGAERKINFLSTSPQRIRKLNGTKHSVLPISMEIQSEYKNLGLFLGALERLEKSVVTVREFTIKGDQAILPKLIMDIIIEIHLKENENG